MEVAKSECIRQAEAAVETIDMSLPVGTVLTEAARQMVNFFTSDFGQRVFRLCVAESDRFPELGREFYESGPALVRDRLIAFMKVGISRNELEIDDLPLAADQFSELCKADLFPRLIFSMDTSFDDTQKKRIVVGAVDTFLARYATQTAKD
jgi:TetR/AcrR family transcriptional repressor of mexJK operon